MKKLSIIALIIGTAAATGYFVTKMIQKRRNNDDLFDEYDECCDCADCEACEACIASEDDLDVEIPDENADEQSDEDDADADVEEDK